MARRNACVGFADVGWFNQLRPNPAGRVERQPRDAQLRRRVLEQLTVFVAVARHALML